MCHRLRQEGWHRPGAAPWGGPQSSPARGRRVLSEDERPCAGKEPPKAASVPHRIPVLWQRCPPRCSTWRTGERSGAPRPAWPSQRLPGPHGRCPPAKARPSCCRCPPCPRPGSVPGSGGQCRRGSGVTTGPSGAGTGRVLGDTDLSVPHAGRARIGCGRAARGRRGGPRCSTASSPTSPTSARWRGGCSASSAISTRESYRPSVRG